MIIDKRLNLVVALDRGGGEPPLYVHSEPLRLETFKTYHLVLSKTFATLMGEKLSVTAGPGVAALVLEEVAKTTNRAPGVTWWEGVDGVENGLLAEMRRLCNVVAPGPDGAGWAASPLQVALDRTPPVLDEEELLEVMNQVTFFTVISSAAPRKDRPAMIRGAAYLFDGQTVSLNCMEYAASLRTSTPGENTGGRVAASSIPH